MNRKVDIYLKNVTKWRAEFEALRAIALDPGLTEDLKWGHPCYTLNNANVILLHGFKNYCAIAFFKGALLKDPKGLLIQQTENVQSGRQLRFTNVQEIVAKERLIKGYIAQAIEVEESGSKVEFKKAAEFETPKEVLVALKRIPGLSVAFNRLTPGRRHGYVLHFVAAKQAKTLEARVQRCAPKILKGEGLNDF